eukprot:jgi/Botrbrau1/12763/Bobra.0238s0002.1
MGTEARSNALRLLLAATGYSSGPLLGIYVEKSRSRLSDTQHVRPTSVFDFHLLKSQKALEKSPKLLDVWIRRAARQPRSSDTSACELKRKADGHFIQILGAVPGAVRAAGGSQTRGGTSSGQVCLDVHRRLQ